MKMTFLGNGHNVAEEDRSFVDYLKTVYDLNQKITQQMHFVQNVET